MMRRDKHAAHFGPSYYFGPRRRRLTEAWDYFVRRMDWYERHPL